VWALAVCSSSTGGVLGSAHVFLSFIILAPILLSCRLFARLRLLVPPGTLPKKEMPARCRKKDER
jgi:hypothetical protein